MGNSKPRELTYEEVRENFLRCVNSIVKYWAALPDRSAEDKCDGVAFSIMAMLDGCNGAMPGFVVAPCPHPDDKKYCKDNGENWYPQNNTERIRCDIAGSLHEVMGRYRD